MKRSIKWHEECLKNMKGTLDRIDEDIARMVKHKGIIQREIDFLKLQIDEATKKKKDGFDNYLFLRKKGA